MTRPPASGSRAGAGGDAQGLVHGRQLISMTQVGSVAHTADDHVGAILPAERDGQPGHAVTENRPSSRKFPAQLDRPFRWGAGRLLLGIDSHEYGDPREKMPCRLDDVEMTGCDWVEGAGIDRMLTQPLRQSHQQGDFPPPPG